MLSICTSCGRAANHVGAIITDAKGQQIKAGTTVTDAMLGDGIARGTIPQEKGDVASISSSTGLGRMRPTSQKEPQCMPPDGHVRHAGRAVQQHSGAEFESVGGVRMAARQDHRRRYKCHPPRKFNYRIMWADGHTRAPPSSLSPTTATAPRCLQLVGHPAAQGLMA